MGHFVVFCLRGVFVFKLVRPFPHAASEIDNEGGRVLSHFDILELLHLLHLWGNLFQFVCSEIHF